jgi:hypothetical protein
MAQDLGNITTSQTFQNWFNKTNDIVDLLASNVVTAAAGGSTTTGSATLTGNLTAGNVIGSTKISTNTIEAISSNTPVNVNGAFKVTGSAQLTTTFLNSAGAQTRYTNGSLSWDVGLENSNPGNFIINTGVAPNKFSLSTAGTLTVPNAVVTGSLTVGSLTIGAGGAGLSTDDVTEGATNLYHTTARARAAFSAGDGINLSATGVISFDGQGELDTYKGNKFIGTGGYVDANNYGYIEGRASGGQGYLRIARYVGGTDTRLVDFAANMNVYSAIYTFGDTYNYVSNGGNLTYHHDVSLNTSTYYSGGSTKRVEINGNTGSAVFVGDLTSNGSLSDERLKENIKPLEKGLETIEQIKTYTFNYKARPQDTHPGVIAQEIEKLVPEVVYDIEMEDGIYKAVRYQQLVPLLINAIKDLSEKVNVLENKLNNKE